MRDKLIELINHAKEMREADAMDIVRESECDIFDKLAALRSEAEYISDHLIANGVVVQEWIPVSERLPENGEVVQIWCGEHQIARFNRGISAAERESMKRGEMGNPEEFGWSLSTGYIRNKRSDVIKSCDEWGNNTVPYNWESTCGPMKWFGQNVTHWKPKEEPPKGE